MRLARDLVFAASNSVWTIVASLVAIPVYLRILGIEAYGLVGFVATLQLVMQLLDMGITPTVNREIARGRAREDRTLGELLNAFATVTWVTASIIAIGVYAFRAGIAGSWIHSERMSAEFLAHIVAVIGLLVACRWPIALYQGVLMGAHRLVAVSQVNIVMVTLAHLGGILVIIFVSPSVSALFQWQCVVALVQVLVLRRLAWRVVGAAPAIPAWSAVKRAWRMSVGMGAVGITGLLIGQVDKLMLSALFDLEQFGYYMLASGLVAGLSVFVSPMFNATFPRFSTMLAQGDDAGVRELYLIATRVLASIVFPLAALFAVAGEGLIHVWTGNPQLAAQVAPVLALLALGSALQSVMHMPYALQIAAGRTRMLFFQNMGLLAFFLPAVAWMAIRHGVAGAAAAWLALNAVYFAVGVLLTRRIVSKGTQSRWLLRAIAVPALLAAIFAWGLDALVVERGLGPVTQLAIGTAGLACTIAACMLLHAPLRKAILDISRGVRGLGEGTR